MSPYEIIKNNNESMRSDKTLSVGKKLTTNTTDGTYKKHAPMIEQNDDTVT